MQFDPFWLFRSPLSGNVAEKISAPWFSPSLTVNYAGDPAVEERVVNEIASYGSQIGWLNDVVLALAKNAQLPAPLAETVQRMTDTANKIEELKAASRNATLNAATMALDRLKQEQPAAYTALLQTHTADAGA